MVNFRDLGGIKYSREVVIDPETGLLYFRSQMSVPWSRFDFSKSSGLKKLRRDPLLGGMGLARPARSVFCPDRIPATDSQACTVNPLTHWIVHSKETGFKEVV